MHELAITEGILRIIEENAAEQHYSKVIEINLACGELSGVIPECIREVFPFASEGTICEGAEVKFTMLPGSRDFYVENIAVEENS